MKSTTLLLALACLSGIAYAGPVACVNNDTLVNYIALGSTGCTLGPVLLSNFSYTSTANTVFPPPGDAFLVAVAPVTSSAFGSLFEGGPVINMFLSPSGYTLVAGTVQVQSISTTISYDVTVLSTDFVLSYYGMGGDARSDGTHATASVTAAPPCLADGNGIQFCGINAPSARITNFINLRADKVPPNASFDRATFSGLENGFALTLAAPEPATFALLIPGLLCMTLVARGKSRSNARH